MYFSPKQYYYLTQLSIQGRCSNLWGTGATTNVCSLHIYKQQKKNLYWKWNRSQPKATHFILFIVVFIIILMQIREGCCLPLAKLMPWNCCQDPCQIWEQWSWFNMGQGILFPFSWWWLQLFLGSWDVCYPEPFLCSHHLVWWHDSLLVYTWRLT